jgi:hypothetical protein
MMQDLLPIHSIGHISHMHIHLDRSVWLCCVALEGTVGKMCGRSRLDLQYTIDSSRVHVSMIPQSVVLLFTRGRRRGVE